MVSLEIEFSFESLILIIFLLATFSINLYITFISPIVFGDEGFHTHMARWIGVHKEIPKFTPLYGTLIHKEGFARPPLWNILEGSFYIFGFNEMIVKILVPFLTLLSGLAIYSIFKRIWNERVSLIAALIYVSLPCVVTYSVLFYVDMLVNFWIILSLGSFCLWEKFKNRKYLLLSALFAGFAILTKTTGYFLIVFYLLYFAFKLLKEKKLVWLKNFGLVIGLLLLTLSGWMVRNYFFFSTPLTNLPFNLLKGKTVIKPNYKPIYKFEGRIAEIGTEASVFKIGLVEYFEFAYGFIWFFPLLLFPSLFYLLFRRKEFDKLLLLMLLAALPGFYVFKSARAEDVARYNLYSVPILALMVSVYLEKFLDWTKKYSKYLPLLLILCITLISFFNFLGKARIMIRVKQFSPLFFEACNWIKQNLPSNATLLSLHTHPTVYNCERKAIWELVDLPDILLSQNLNLTLSRLKANGIDYIFVQKFSLSSGKYRQTYPLSFVQFLENNPDHFKKVYENGPSLDECLAMGGCDGTILYKVVY